MAASFYGHSRLPFASPQNSANPPLPCSSQAPLRPRQTFPAAPTSPWGRGSVLLRRFKAGLPAFKTRQNSPNPPLQLPGATQAAADLSCSSNKSLKPWQCPFKEVQGSRSPAFKTRQNSPNPPLQLPGATQAAADLSCSSNKSLRPWQCPFMEVQGCLLPAFETRLTPQTLPCSSQAPLRSRQTLRPWQRLFMDVQGCRLPALKTPQTLPCSSQAPLRPRQTFPAAPTSPWGPRLVCQPSKLAKTPQTLPCSSQAPLRPRQTFPAAPTSLWGRGSVFLRRFKAAVCQPSKLPKLPGAT